MTLIVGIKCNDGVVMGADSAATFATPTGRSTVIQSATKLQIPAGPIITATSGPMGLGQLFSESIGKLWKEKKIGWGVSREDGMRLIRGAILQDAQVALQSAAIAAQSIGQAAASMSARSSTLVALPVGGGAELISCDHAGNPEAAIDLPYIAIGSGQIPANPFLAFIRRVFWPTGLPRLSQATLAVVWALEHCISIHPGGVDGPIQLAILSKRSGKELTAKILDKPEIDSHREQIAAEESYLGSYGWTSDESTLPKPPSPPSSDPKPQAI